MLYYDNIYYKIGFVILIILCILLFVYIITRLTINKMYESAQEMYYKSFVPKNEYKQYLKDKRKIEQQQQARLQELQQNHGMSGPDLDERIVGIVKPQGTHAKHSMKEQYKQLVELNKAIKANEGGLKGRWQTTTSGKGGKKGGRSI